LPRPAAWTLAKTDHPPAKPGARVQGPAGRVKEILMKSAGKIVVLLVVFTLGLWGCARSPGERAGQSERVRSLEGRCAKLEQDYRTVARARDQARKDKAAAEEEIARLKKELEDKAAVLHERNELAGRLKATVAERDGLRNQVKAVLAERDDLQQQITARVGERDSLAARVERFRKGLQQVLAQDDAPPMMPPASPSVEPPARQSATSADADDE
jgi:hypothetical protein